MRAQMLTLLPAVVVLAACSGASTTTATSAGPAPAAMRGPSTDALASIARGDSLFNAGACQRCHGQKGVGAANGPSLITGQWLHVDGSQAQIATLVVNGVPSDAIKDATRRFAMRARGGPMNLTDAQVQDLANYVVSISRGKSPR